MPKIALGELTIEGNATILDRSDGDAGPDKDGDYGDDDDNNGSDG